jgi:signal transduction histidine kinase
MGRLFAIQITVISLATLIGIYLTQLVVEDLLSRQALNLESEHFWKRYREDPHHPLPDVANMRGYLTSSARPSAVPGSLAALEPGFERADVDGRSLLVHTSDFDGNRLYLLFEVDRVSDLAFYLGVVPLSIVLLLMYLILFTVYRWSQRALSPIVRLANRLEAVDFNSAGHIELDLEPLLNDADSEVEAMIRAVEHFTERLDAAIERERRFTRDAGHELRTPVAVFKGSLDDMESLLETLLLLAREEELALPAEPTLVNDVVTAQLDALRFLIESSGNQVKTRELGELRVRAPAKVIEIVIGNLIRNALTYTSAGEVTITVTDESVVVADTGIGMSENDLLNAFEPFFRAEPSRTATKGHGLGLSIVRRLTRQFGWQLDVESRLHRGTAIEVQFIGTQ